MATSLSLSISKKGSFDPLMEDVSISCASSYTDDDGHHCHGLKHAQHEQPGQQQSNPPSSAIDQNGISVGTITNPEEKMEVAAELSALLHRPSAALDEYIADISNHVVEDSDGNSNENGAEKTVERGAQTNENDAQGGTMIVTPVKSNKKQSLERVSTITMKTSMLTQPSQPSMVDTARLVTPTKSLEENTGGDHSDESFDISIVEMEEKVAAKEKESPSTSTKSKPTHSIHESNYTSNAEDSQPPQSITNTTKKVESKIQPLLINTPPQIPLGIDIDMMMPIISYIQPFSPLREYVSVGDILVFIDGKSTAELSHGVLTKMLNGTKKKKKVGDDSAGGEDEGTTKLIFLPGMYGKKLGLRKQSESDSVAENDNSGAGHAKSSSSISSENAKITNEESKPVLSKRDSDIKFARKSCQGNMDSSSLFIKQESGGSGHSSSIKADSVPQTSSLQPGEGEGNSSDSVREASGHISTVSGSSPISQHAPSANQSQVHANSRGASEGGPHAIPASPESNPAAADSSSRNGNADSPTVSKSQNIFGTPSKTNNKQSTNSPSHTDPTVSSSQGDSLNRSSEHQLNAVSPCRSNAQESSELSPEGLTPKRAGGSSSQVLGIVPPPSCYRNKLSSDNERLGMSETNEVGFRAGILQPQLPNSAMCSLNTITTQLSVQTLGAADCTQALPTKPSQDGQLEESLNTQLTTKILDKKHSSTLVNSQSISPPTLSRSSSEQKMSKSLLTEGQQTFATCKSTEQTFYTCQSKKSNDEQKPVVAEPQSKLIEEVGKGSLKERDESSTEPFSVVPPEGNDQAQQSEELPSSTRGPQSSSSVPRSSFDVENMHEKLSGEPPSSQQSDLPVSNQEIINMKAKLGIVKSQSKESANVQIKTNQAQKTGQSKPADHIPPGDIMDEDDRRRLERRNRPAPQFDYVEVDNNGTAGGQNDEVSTIYGGKWNSALHTSGQRLEDNLGYMEEGYLGGYGGVSVTGRSVDTRSIIYGNSSRVGNAQQYYDPNTQSQLQQNPNLLGLANSNAQQYENDATARKNKVAEDEQERKESLLKQMKKQQHCVEGFLVTLIVLSVVALVIILVMVLRNK